MSVGAYSVHLAKYARGMRLVRVARTGGFKSRAARLLGALGARWTSRERGYVVSRRRAALFERLLNEGWDADFWGPNLYLGTPDMVRDRYDVEQDLVGILSDG